VTAILVQLLLALTAAPSCPAFRADSACIRARFFLLNRHLSASYLDSCAAALAIAPRTGPQNEERLALRAQLLLTLGELAPASKTRADHYAAARAAAESLRALNEKNPLGHVWWAAAQARILQLRGIGASAIGSAGVRRANERAFALDPGCALASFALGRMYEELPGLLGGGLTKAAALYRRGVASDSSYTIIRLALARVLARQGRRDEARAQLERLLAVTDPSNPAEFVLDDRPAAQALLDRLGRD